MPDAVRLGDLAERATHALRNSLGNMAAMAYVVGEAPGVDREALGEMLRNMALVALDAELLADLATAANPPAPADGAGLRELLTDAVRPFGWFTSLAGAEGGAIQVEVPAELEAPFLRPVEVAATGRRLVASVIGRCRPTGVVLEAAGHAGGVQLLARADGAAIPVELAPAPTEPGWGGNYLDLEMLAVCLRRPGLVATLYLGDGGRYAAAWLRPA